MGKSLQKIKIKGIRLYSYHGCMDEEGRIGSDYEVNLTVWADLIKSSKTDALVDTVDYVHLNLIVEEEMAVRSKLLEEVARRINQRILKELNKVEKVKVSVAKMAPPIEGDVKSVAVIFKDKRN